MKPHSLLPAVQRAFYGHRSLAQHMGIEHGRSDVRMAQQLLNCPDVAPSLQQVRREAVSEGVTTRRLQNPSASNGRLDCALNHFLMQMVADGTTRKGIL